MNIDTASINSKPISLTMDITRTKLTTTRRVRFFPLVSLTKKSGLLPFNELKDLWYNKTDLALFRSEQRSEAHREGVSAYAAHHDSRCLEQNRRVVRLKYKYLTIQCTLSAYGRGIGVDKTAKIAQKCSAWNAQLAIVQAFQNYCDIYEPTMAKMGPTATSMVPPKFPFAMKPKRVASEYNAVSESSRRVRARRHQ